ncbi:MAG: hypothetical protein N2516_03025 [Dictyoglomaceae bacterium]|nr:hypothetical protein [Dictyoglomaceae bacterium]
MRNEDFLEHTFSKWMRSNLKDAYRGLITQDVDFVIIEDQKILFIEEKNSKNARIGPAQKIIFKMFSDLLEGNRFFNYVFDGISTVYVTNEITLEELMLEIKNNKMKKFTIEKEIFNRLWDCKGDSIIKKTERERSGYRDSISKKIFNKYEYITNPPQRYVEKIDWIFLNYCTGYFIFIEEKINNESNLIHKRRNFIRVIDNVFTLASNINKLQKRAKNPKSEVLYEYLGYYKIVFSKTNPDNSDSIYLNNTKIKKSHLIELLNLDTNEILKYRLKFC